MDYYKKKCIFAQLINKKNITFAYRLSIKNIEKWKNKKRKNW